LQVVIGFRRTGLVQRDPGVDDRGLGASAEIVEIQMVIAVAIPTVMSARFVITCSSLRI